MRDRIVDLALATLALVAPAAEREQVVGDLDEEWSTAIAPALGRAAARAWVCSQVLRSLPSLVALRWRRFELQPAIAGLLAAGVASMAVALAAAAAWRALLSQVPLRASHAPPLGWSLAAILVQLVLGAAAAMAAGHLVSRWGGSRR